MSEFYGNPDDPCYHGPDCEPRPAPRYRQDDDAIDRAIEALDVKFASERAAINAEMGDKL